MRISAPTEAKFEKDFFSMSIIGRDTPFRVEFVTFRFPSGFTVK